MFSRIRRKLLFEIQSSGSLESVDAHVQLLVASLEGCNVSVTVVVTYTHPRTLTHPLRSGLAYYDTAGLNSICLYVYLCSTHPVPCLVPLCRSCCCLMTSPVGTEALELVAGIADDTDTRNRRILLKSQTFNEVFNPRIAEINV